MQAEGEKTTDLRDFNLRPPQTLTLEVHPDAKLRARIVVTVVGSWP